ncbi:DUF418 domain-containing protein [Streptomyces sp. NBC_01231]|nr:DUF418 domain-containing protein [Streptomyces sp. NBC_01231]
MNQVDSAYHWYPIAKFLDLFVQERFFPIFCFLFGLSFAIFLDSAAQRSDRPRLLLTRRLIALGLLGAAHQLLQPGEALAPYAIVGLVILLPATWLPTWLVLTGGLLGTVASVTLVGGGILSIPGLFLLGLAVARLGIAHTLDRRTGQLAAVLALAAPAAAAAVWCQHTYSSLGPFATRIAAEAGLLGALTYATALLLLLRTPLGRPLSAVLEPLGRMALTNYITATLAVTAASPLLDLRDSGRWGTAMLLAAGIIQPLVAAPVPLRTPGVVPALPHLVDHRAHHPLPGGSRLKRVRRARPEAGGDDARRQGQAECWGHSQDRLLACDFGAQCRKAPSWAMILPMRYHPGPGRDARCLRTPSHLTCSFRDAHGLLTVRIVAADERWPVRLTNISIEWQGLLLRCRCSAGWPPSPSSVRSAVLADDPCYGQGRRVIGDL